MAQLMLISARTYRIGINNIGDVVDVSEDSHVFNTREKTIFKILKVKGTVVQVMSTMRIQKSLNMDEDSAKYAFKVLDTDKEEVAGNIVCNLTT